MKKALIAVAATLAVLTASAHAVPYYPKPKPKLVATGSSSHSTPWFVWGIIGCSAGIVLTAVMKNAMENRELTAYEASTCGIGAWWR